MLTRRRMEPRPTAAPHASKAPVPGWGSTQALQRPRLGASQRSKVTAAQRDALPGAEPTPSALGGSYHQNCGSAKHSYRL